VVGIVTTTVSNMEIQRWAAFSTTPDGGNPAGVVLDATGLGDDEMLGIAADLGYSETAFLFPGEHPGSERMRIRYFSPLAEVDFCGHATVATAVALATAGRPGAIVLDTNVGDIPVTTQRSEDGVEATLTGVEPAVAEIAADVRARLLETLRLTTDDLDPTLPVRAAFGGNWHPVVPVTADALVGLDQDHDALLALMIEQAWTTTVAVVHRVSDSEFLARNPFPPGGVREDPATGAAAAALGGYLRTIGAVRPPARVLVRQGEQIGRPGRLIVDIPATGGISVSGVAVPID
jgi:PhzF family phenazine biosynthesis protein